MYAEEVELYYRLKQAEYLAWIVPEAKIIHFEGMSGERLSSNLRKSSYSIRWYSKFVFLGSCILHSKPTLFILPIS